MATSTLNLKTILLAAGLAFIARAATASDYQPFPDTTPGTVYRWKSYLVDEHGQQKLRGIYTNTVEGRTLIGQHEYIVIKSVNPENKPLPGLIYRCDDSLFGMLLGPTEDSLLVHWKGAPSAGQAWTCRSQKIVIRGQEDVEVDGTVYQDCWVLDQFNDGQLVNRSYFDRDAGWIKSTMFRNGKMTATGYRLSGGTDQ